MSRRGITTCLLELSCTRLCQMARARTPALTSNRLSDSRVWWQPCEGEASSAVAFELSERRCTFRQTCVSVQRQSFELVPTIASLLGRKLSQLRAGVQEGEQLPKLHSVCRFQVFSSSTLRHSPRSSCHTHSVCGEGLNGTPADVVCTTMVGLYPWVHNLRASDRAAVQHWQEVMIACSSYSC